MPDLRPPGAAIPSAKSMYVVKIPLAAMAVGLQRSGNWLASLHRDQCAAPSANHRCAIGLLPLPREEFRLLKLILHSELRRRAASRRAHVTPSQSPTLNFKPNFKFSRLNFLGGPPSQFECALGSFDQSIALVKI